MHIDPQRLLVLRAVANAGGVAAAARQLHLAPSGVSQHVAALERETGLALVDRSRRGGQRPLRLTALGRRLAAHGDALGEVLAAAEADVVALTGAPVGAVRLAAFPSAIAGVVVPALRVLAQSHPLVRTGVLELDERPAVAALYAGDLDLVVVESDAGQPEVVPAGCVSTELLVDPYRLAVPASWPVPRSVRDVAERAWVEGLPGSAVARVLQRLRESTGMSLEGAHCCQEFPAVLSLVAAGAGIALVPHLALAEGLAPEVQMVTLPGLGARRISALGLTTSARRPIVQALTGAMVAACASRG